MGLGVPVAAGLTHAAAVADSVEEAAVTCVAGVAARQLVAQARLLVGHTAAGGAHGPALELQGFRHLLGGVLQSPDANKTKKPDIFVEFQAICPAS